MSAETFDYSNILIELNKAVKMHNFYPQGHPQLDAALEKCFLQLKRTLGVQLEIKWRVDQKGFYDGKTPLAPGNMDVAGLAKRLFFRRIKELTFTDRLTAGDLKIFLSVVKLEPEELQALGGAEAYFAEKDVNGILINALNYDDLRKIKKELEEKKKDQEKVIEEEKKKEEEEAGESQKIEEIQDLPPLPEPGPVKEDTLPELIEKLKKERDFLKYHDISVRIREKAEVVLMERRFEEIFPAMVVLLEHALPTSELAGDIKATASERLASLFTREMIKYLVVRAGNKDEPYRTAIHRMLLSAGEEAVEELLDAIIEAQEAVRRRNLFNALVLFGGRIRPQVEGRLKHKEWYVVRQMLALLGELGDPDSIGAIEGTFSHPEVRVKKEAMKALVKIHSPRSTQILLRMLGDEDPSVVMQAIISLGMLKDPGAIEALGAIATKREAFADNQDQKKEAVKALGIIGDRKALPYLTGILFRKVWFGKRSNEEMRAMAAWSLGAIGGEDAINAVKQAAQDSEGELYHACKRILEGREKT